MKGLFSRRGSIALAATGVLVGALVLSGCSNVSSAGQLDSFSVIQGAPVLADHPDPDFIPNSTGAVLFFAADLRDSEGNAFGELFGQVTTLDITLDGVEEEDRLRELVFNLNDGQLICMGASQYAASRVPDFGDDNAPVTAVIVGGTEAYTGARGTVVTEKLDDGTFTHNFIFVD
jgi:hypothetical protein|tara:strand:+ start:964 stop:1488 length:525 start_codon:yes stop_codon:yes gene_type:complete